MGVFPIEAPPAPLLAPYAHLDTESVQCIAGAARYYQVPELLLHAIVQKENGRVGQAVRNRNGTYDLGLGQINSSWGAHFAKYGVSLHQLLNDRCTNLYAAGYVLRLNVNVLGGKDWFRAAMAYNVGLRGLKQPARYRVGYAYASAVLKRWQDLHARVFGTRTPPRSARKTSRTSGSLNTHSLYELDRPAATARASRAMPGLGAADKEFSMKSVSFRFTLKSAVAVAVGLALSTPSFAGTIDSNDAFYSFYRTVDQWVGGALGTGLAITMLLLGAAVGVGKNSPMPALVGVAGAAFLHWGPEIIKSIMVSGAVL